MFRFSKVDVKEQLYAICAAAHDGRWCNIGRNGEGAMQVCKTAICEQHGDFFLSEHTLVSNIKRDFYLDVYTILNRI